ncbi:MAG: radical SAM protein, partial [Nitrospinota bacterium]|nr:radical SAM protein [Nitrospinota bacterium]
RRPVASMATTRGCPYECTFCSTIQMWTRNWRKVSIDRVVEEIEDLQKNYGVREIAFYDDAFLIDRKRVLGICEEIIKRKLDIKFTIPPGINVINLDEELIIKMKQAGLYRVTLPIETGNKETQKFIKKPIDLDHARKMIDVCNRKGIWSQANFVVGFLYETQSQVDETLEYSYSLNLDYIFYYVAQPYAGSELYEIYEEQNLLDGKYDSMSTMWDTKYETKHFKPEDLRKITDEAMKKHFKIRVLSYLNPIYFFQFLWPKIKTWEQFKFFLGIVFNREKVKNIIINQ